MLHDLWVCPHSFWNYMLCNVFVNFFHMQEVMEANTSCQWWRDIGEYYSHWYLCIMLFLTSQILVVIKSNSHQGEQGNKSLSPKSRHISNGRNIRFQRELLSIFIFFLLWIICSLHFYCGKFLSDLFSLAFQLLIFSCKSMLWLSSKPIFQQSPAGKDFPMGFLNPYIVSYNRAFSSALAK